MNIALIGYGKMGKTIEPIAENRGHSVVLKLNETPKHYQLIDHKVDVAIEFSNPQAAYNNTVMLLQSNIPVVSGTTGWENKLKEVLGLVDQYNGSFIHSTNYSLGVNLFFDIVQKSMLLMREHPMYHLLIKEIHHKQKVDAPSGTAITIAEKIMEVSSFDKWHLKTNEDEPTSADSIEIIAERLDDVKGTHLVEFLSDIDSIQLKHEAFTREGFALGAVLAAEYIYNKNGIFTMKDVLNLK